MQKPVDLIIDIETLGTEPGATILEIGAWSGAYGLNLLIDPNSHPGKIELGTMLWWATVPDKAAKENVFGENEKRYTLEAAIIRLNEFIEKINPDYFWGNSPDFDFGHLAYWYKYFNKPIPWKYYQLRDVRTAKDFLTQEKLDELKARAPVSIGSCSHMAEFDAHYEALIVRTVREKIELLK